MGASLATVSTGPLILYGGDGGIGAAIGGNTLINTGVIAGGSGRVVLGPAVSLVQQAGGWGGAGVAVSGGSLGNSGTIRGGAGGAAISFGTRFGGSGGHGVTISSGSINNAGTIAGGNGGVASLIGGTDNYASIGGVGGDGVRVTGGILTNSGTITGGTGGAAVSSLFALEGKGGVGVSFASGGTLTNTGTIRGGSDANAVDFGTGASRLILGAGASFTGNVVANATVTNVLELTSGASSGTISGIGSQFVGFSRINVNTGSTWTWSGTNTIGAGVTLSVSNASLTNAGALLNNGTIQLNGGALLTSGSLMTIGAGATLAGNGTVNAPLTVTGRANATGGLLTLNGAIGGSGTLEVLSNGTLELTGTVASTATIDFSSGTLEIDAPSLFQGKLLGMQTGDVIGFGTLSAANVDYTQAVSTGTLAVSFVGGGSMSLSVIGTYAPSQFFIDNGDINVACFVAGTCILTERGEVPVEDLTTDDEVQTSDGPRRVAWIGYRRMDPRRHPRPRAVHPIRVRTGALGDGTPHRDLLLSPDHAVLVRDRLIPVKHLVNGTTVLRDHHYDFITYFHVETEQHSILYAHGAPVESYLDTGNRDGFENGGGAIALHPDFGAGDGQQRREAASCRPLAADDATRRSLWSMIATRSAELGYRGPETSAVREPRLRLKVGSHLVMPINGRDGRFLFALPEGASTVRLLSRACAPDLLEPWIDDQRELGVAVRRIRFWGPNGLTDLPVDSPALVSGWWQVEGHGTALWRWTDGNAEIPIDLDTNLLEIEAAGLAAYVEEAEGNGAWARVA